jgi:hypothetical protein
MGAFLLIVDTVILEVEMSKIQIDEELFDEMVELFKKSVFAGKFEGANGIVRFCWCCQEQWTSGREGDGVPNHKSDCKLQALLKKTKEICYV